MKRRASSLFAFVFLLLPPLGAHAEQLTELHARATDLAGKGEHREALEAYHELERAGVEDESVFYDRALAHAQLGELGHAIVWLERARRLAPDDAEIVEAARRAELALRGRREAEHHGEPLMEPPSVLRALTPPLRTGTLAVLSLVFELLAFAAVGAMIFTERERLRVALGLLASFCFALFLAMLLGVGDRLEWFSDGRAAVVVAPEATLRAGPDAQAAGRRILREGDRLRVLAERRNFSEVRLPDGQRGFVDAERIRALSD